MMNNQKLKYSDLKFLFRNVSLPVFNEKAGEHYFGFNESAVKTISTCRLEALSQIREEIKERKLCNADYPTDNLFNICMGYMERINEALSLVVVSERTPIIRIRGGHKSRQRSFFDDFKREG